MPTNAAPQPSRSISTQNDLGSDTLAFRSTSLIYRTTIYLPPITVEDPPDLLDIPDAVVLPTELPPGCTYEVYVGPTGTTSDPIAYSGVPGQGSQICTLPDSGDLPFVLPELEPGVYTVTVLDTSTGETTTFPEAVTVSPRDLRSKTYALRRKLPSWLAVGPRSVADEAALA
jgi:hypothetical protein